MDVVEKPEAIKKFHLITQHGKKNDAGIYVADFRIVAAVGSEVDIDEIENYLESLLK